MQFNTISQILCVFLTYGLGTAWHSETISAFSAAIALNFELALMSLATSLPQEMFCSRLKTIEIWVLIFQASEEIHARALR